MPRSTGTVEFKATPADLNITGAKFEAGPFHFEVKAPETAGKGDRRQPCGIEMKTRRSEGDQAGRPEGGRPDLRGGARDERPIR